MLAVIVLVPMVVELLLLWLDFPSGIPKGLALSALAPGAPLTTKRSQLAAARFSYAADLQLTLALPAVLEGRG